MTLSMQVPDVDTTRFRPSMSSDWAAAIDEDSLAREVFTFTEAAGRPLSGIVNAAGPAFSRDTFRNLWGAVGQDGYLASVGETRPFQIPDLHDQFMIRTEAGSEPEEDLDDGVQEALDDLREEITLRVEELGDSAQELTQKLEVVEDLIKTQQVQIRDLQMSFESLKTDYLQLARELSPVLQEWRENHRIRYHQDLSRAGTWGEYYSRTPAPGGADRYDFNEFIQEVR